VIFAATKKKELVGDFKSAGRGWQKKGEPSKLWISNNVDSELGKAIPYGIFDIGRYEDWVSFRITHGFRTICDSPKKKRKTAIGLLGLWKTEFFRFK
jgi:hypothetical protein